MIPKNGATFLERLPAMIFWMLVFIICFPFAALALVFGTVPDKAIKRFGS